MSHPPYSRSNAGSKRHLLSGTSLPAIVLAATITATGPAIAQEIIGNDATTANLLAPGAGVDIISGNAGDQFGAIDVDSNTLYNSITLTQSETISVFDSVANSNVTGIVTDFEIASSASGTLVFARSATGIAAGHANMHISGDLEGLNDSRGGDLAISAFEGSGDSASSFLAQGSTYMGALSVTAANAVVGNGGDMSMGFGFGNNNDTFDAFGLTVTGGNGLAANNGGDASSSVSVDGTDNNTAIFGAGGIIITAGDGGTTGNGGLSRLTVIGSATIDGAVTVTGGNEGTGTGDGGNASIDFSENAGTVIFNSALTIATGMDTGTGGNAEAIFASATVNANGGVVLSEQQNATATLTLDGNGDQTFNGTITAANDGDGEIFVNSLNGGANTIRFSGAIGTDARRIGTIDIDHNDTVAFQANVFANILEVAAGTTAIFAGATSVLEGTASQAGEVIIGNGTDAAMLTIEGDAEHTGGTTINNLGTLVIDATGAPSTVTGIINGTAGATTTLQTTGNDLVTFQGNVGTVQPISLIDLDTDTTFDLTVSGGEFDIDANMTAAGDLTASGNVDVADTFTALLDSADNAIAGDITGDGSLLLGTGPDELTIGADGQTSTVSIATLGSAAGFDHGSIVIADGAMVTIETTIGAGDSIRAFSTDDGAGTDTVLTINSSDTTAITGFSSLTLGAGTIVLGRNIGDGDTVFSFIGDHTGPVTTANETTTVQLSANFFDGDITFAATNADQSTAIDGDASTNGTIFLTQTALTEFALATAAGTVADSDITITAIARSTSDTADELGISEEDAVAMREAVISTDATGDDEGLDALTTVLNADDDGASAAQAAQTVGTQADTLSGASQTAFATSAEQTSTITARLESVRGLTGFSGGDLPGQYSQQAAYSPQAPASIGGVWGQAFGGFAGADGDSNHAGYDASYGGLIAGIDGMASEDITIGAFGSYSFSSVDGDGAGNSQIDANTFGFGVYAGYAGDSFYLDGFAAYAFSQNNLSRQDILNRTITADYDASQFSVGLAGGVPFEMSSNLVITPNASLT